MLLPAAIRYAIEVDAAGVGGISSELEPLINQFVEKIGELEQANVYPDGIEGLELAEYARDKQLAKMSEVREVADALEQIVADDLWPLPKYSEILFIK
jgi:glutamine synthetase